MGHPLSPHRPAKARPHFDLAAAHHVTALKLRSCPGVSLWERTGTHDVRDPQNGQRKFQQVSCFLSCRSVGGCACQSGFSHLVPPICFSPPRGKQCPSFKLESNSRDSVPYATWKDGYQALSRFSHSVTSSGLQVVMTCESLEQFPITFAAQ